MQRRQFLGLAGLLAFPMRIFAENRPLTPSDVEGPFYPVSPIPLRSAMLKDQSQSKNKTMQLSGRILDTQGRPILNAKIEIWQCDQQGIYDHPQQYQREKFNKAFLGAGAQVTDQQGNYNFTTLFPVPYTGRPPHIHVKVWQNDKELLTTQLYLQGNTGGFWAKKKREALQINPRRTMQNQFSAKFTFIV